MKRIAFTALCSVALGGMGVFALPIDNRVNPDGTPVLIPAVRKYEPRGGTLALPAEITVAAPDAAANEFEVLAAVVAERFPDRKVTKGGADSAFCRLEVVATGVPESVEGYTLAIDGSGIAIRSRDVRGLYYGVRTLGNLLRNAAKPELPRCAITDFPKLRMRGIYRILRKRGSDGNVGSLLREIDAAGALKYNMMMLEFGETYPYPDNPFTERKTSYTAADVSAIKAAAKRNRIEIVPTLQILSHDQWLWAHPRYKTDISETPKRNTWSTCSCPLKPLVRELNLMAIREHIAAFKPRYFNISMDEADGCGWGTCPECRKIDAKERWREETLFYTNEVLKHGVIPIIYHDMYYPGNRVGGVEVLPKLDKRVMICNWDYSGKIKGARFDFFRERGFHLFGMSFCARLDNIKKLPAEMLRRGEDGVFLSFWGAFRDPSDPKNCNPGGLAGFTLGGFYEWNPAAPCPTALTFDPAWEALRLAVPQAAVEAPAGTRFTAFPLDGVFNAKLGRDPRFPTTDAKIAAALQKEAAAAPEKFHVATSPDGGVLAVLVGGERKAAQSVTIPVNAKAEWLAFSAMAGSAVGGRREAARLTVRYADGRSTAIPLLGGLDLRNWNEVASGYGIRFVSRFNDSRGAMAALFARNWRNPSPEKEIRSLELSATRRDVPTALFALSLGGVSRPCAVPDDRGAAARLGWNIPPSPPAVNAKTPGATVLTDYSEGKVHRAKIYITTDMSAVVKQGKGLGGAKSTTAECFDGKLAWTIVDDPSSPDGGKVLKISVPALKPQYRNLRARLVMDLSFTPLDPKKMKTVFFDYRVSHPEYQEWPGFYLMSSKPFRAAVCAGYMSGRSDRGWHHMVTPVKALSNEGEPLVLAEADTIRMSYFLRDLAEPSEIRLGAIGIAPVAGKGGRPLRAEKISEDPSEEPSEIFYIESF